MNWWEKSTASTRVACCCITKSWENWQLTGGACTGSGRSPWPLANNQGPRAKDQASRFREDTVVQLLRQFYVGVLGFHELLAVTLDGDFHRDFDACHLLELAVRGFLFDFLAAHRFFETSRTLDEQASLLVEIKVDVVMVFARNFDSERLP